MISSRLGTNGLIRTHFIPLCADFGLPAVGAASGSTRG